MNKNIFETPPENLKNYLILSSPLLEGSIFERSCILITDKTPAGYEGYIINHVTNQTVEDLLPQAKHSILNTLPVYIGGPVHPGTLNFIAITSSLEKGFIVRANIKIEQAESLALEANTIILPCLGYAGWAPKQLESEFEQFTWFHCPPPFDLTKSKFNLKLWKSLLAAISPYHRLVANAPKSSNLN